MNALAPLALLAVLPTLVFGHGLMVGPASRQYLASNWNNPDFAYDDCPHCANRGGVCGVSQTGSASYNPPLDANNQPFLPTVTDCYMPGGTIDIEFVITAHHYGHIEMRLCDDPSNPTQECFDRTPLEFISDESFLERAVKDTDHPERGYLHPNNDDAIPADEDWRRDQIPFGGGMNFKMTYRIPENVECEHCLLQWTYVTGNSCNSVGYSTYPFPSETWWRPYLSDCPNPPPRNGLVENIPEMFWNCADVRIASDCSASASPDTDTDTDLPIEEDQGQGESESENSENNDAGDEGDLQKERSRHVRYFNSQCQDKIWEQNYVTGEPEVYTCADYASWGHCDEDWMEGWCDKTCDKCCQDHMWETNYNTQQPEVYTCADYASWGFCGEDWMDGWCEATCGRCSQPADNGSDGDAGSGDVSDDAGSGDGNAGDGDMAGDEDDSDDDVSDDTSGGDGADGSSGEPGTVEERLAALEEEVEAIRAQVEDMSNQLL